MKVKHKIIIVGSGGAIGLHVLDKLKQKGIYAEMVNPNEIKKDVVFPLCAPINITVPFFEPLTRAQRRKQLRKKY